MKIGIVGSGVSGLMCAYLLGRNHDVTVFESQNRFGGHINTVECADGEKTVHVDTGFIVHNEQNYPLFSKLLRTIGSETQDSDMSFSVRHDPSRTEFSGRNLDTLFTSRRNLVSPDHWSMIRDIRRFFDVASNRVERGQSVADFLAQHGFGKPFWERFLCPLCCSLWSCPPSLAAEFPISYVAGFLKNHGMLTLKGRPTWKVVVGGSNSYLERLLKHIQARTNSGCPVNSIKRLEGAVQISTPVGNHDFDEVIVACHADEALALLQTPNSRESALLSSFQFQSNDVVLHTDISVLPKNPKAWASWNYRVPTTDQASSTVTYNMNMLQKLTSKTTFLVSLNEPNIEPSKVIKHIHYAHPVGAAAAEVARDQRTALVRNDRISYCGAYWGYGFHEDGVRSAVEVAQAFGERFDA
ncbi:MAG: FAD-dependent oxidoreductase [Fimbriimonadaceae bacterium]